VSERPAPVPDLDWEPERARELGGAAVELWAELLGRLPELPVSRGLGAAEVRDLLELEVPEEGLSNAELMDRLRPLVFDASMFPGHPGFSAYVSGAGTVPGAVADLLAAALNQNLGGFRLSPGANQVEAALVRFLASSFGLPETAGGQVVAGGAIANFVGLKVARDAALGPDARARGVAAGPPLAFYASSEAHVVHQRAADMLGGRGLLPDVLHTSVLRRAIVTAQLCLDDIDRHWIPVRRSWRLNERHYGALQGKDKKQTLAEYGEEQFMTWRRSYDTPPPPIDDDDEFSQSGDQRYADLPPELLPRTECLADVIERMLPYWYDAVVPDLRAGRTVLVTAHGNSLRGLVKHLDGLTEKAVVGLNIPTGIPLLYELDENLSPVIAGGEYLDPEAAAAAIEAVRNQGR